jgi:Raf kinase inhibitor-like YbhB/YbcL family protein
MSSEFPMKLTSTAFADNGAIPSDFAFCAPDAATHVTLSKNLSPDLAWSDLPPGTKSLALICHDYDVPSKADDVNQEGKSIPASLPRIDFYHWVLVDLPPALGGIARGAFSDSVTAKGKPGPNGPHGTRQGVNDYTLWFGGNADMGGDYYGYDGCCPPWNDTIVHHYVFTLYALDVARAPVEGRFTGGEALAAIKPHVLGKAAITGLYSLNPAVPAKA